MRATISETRHVDIVLGGIKAQVTLATGQEPKVALIDMTPRSRGDGMTSNNRIDLKGAQLRELLDALIEVEAFIATAKDA